MIRQTPYEGTITFEISLECGKTVLLLVFKRFWILDIIELCVILLDQRSLDSLDAVYVVCYSLLRDEGPLNGAPPID